MNGRYQLAGITGDEGRLADPSPDGFAAHADAARRTIAAVRAVAATRKPGRPPGRPLLNRLARTRPGGTGRL